MRGSCYSQVCLCSMVSDVPSWYTAAAAIHCVDWIKPQWRPEMPSSLNGGATSHPFSRSPAARGLGGPLVSLHAPPASFHELPPKSGVGG